MDGNQKSRDQSVDMVVFHIISKVFVHPKWLFGISEPSTVYVWFIFMVNLGTYSNLDVFLLVIFYGFGSHKMKITIKPPVGRICLVHVVLS